MKKPKLYIDENQNMVWTVDGMLHRLDGPAVEQKNNHKEWWVNGLRHREDGPAVIYPDGTREWWVNGNLHREDGPAVEWSNGSVEWWLESFQYTIDEWAEKLNIHNTEKYVLLKMKY